MGKLGLAALGVGLGAGVAAWSLAEAALMQRVRRGVMQLPGDPEQDFSVLHISDLHLLARQHAKRRFIAQLAQSERPDLVIVTGDLIASESALDALLNDLDPLLDLPGVFVFGSNDYFSPKPRNPLQYLWRNTNGSGTGASSSHGQLPASKLTAALRNRGWLDLRNARGTLTVNGHVISFVGVDDPHIDRDRYPIDDGVRGELHLGVAHAPYTRALDAFHAEGCAAAFFGHTHGGQVCVPGHGALVTNCDLPAWRASGLQGWPGLRPDGLAIEPLHRFAPIPAVFADDARRMWVNISAGLGTSPFAPVRLACPPEVSVLRFAHSRDY